MDLFSEVSQKFDIVIGNPPYIQLQKRTSDGRLYGDLYEHLGFETFKRMGDMYCLFYEKGIRFLKDGGILCYVTSNKWMRTAYGAALRKFLLKYNPILLIDLGPGVFKGATVDTNILLIKKEPRKNGFVGGIGFNGANVSMDKVNDGYWFIGDNLQWDLKAKIESIGKPIRNWNVKIYRGLQTGLDKAFIITTEQRQRLLDNCKDQQERIQTELFLKPILRGKDVKRYYYQWAGLWAVVIPAGWTNKNKKEENAERFMQKMYPSLYQYLVMFKELAERRQARGNYWWETRSTAYCDEFDLNKLIWQRLGKGLAFSYDENKFWALATVYILTGVRLKYMLGYLSSKLNQFCSKNWYALVVRGGDIKWVSQDIINLPIPRITVSNEFIICQIEELVDKILDAKKQNPKANTYSWEKEIDHLVYKLYDLTDKEIALVEKS